MSVYEITNKTRFLVAATLLTQVINLLFFFTIGSPPWLNYLAATLAILLGIYCVYRMIYLHAYTNGWCDAYKKATNDAINIIDTSFKAFTSIKGNERK